MLTNYGKVLHLSPRKMKKPARPITRESRLLAPAQSGLLGADITRVPSDRDALLKHRLFYNIADPTSTSICGSQGSGKSHTYSSILKDCSISCEAGYLPPDVRDRHETLLVSRSRNPVDS